MLRSWLPAVGLICGCGRFGFSDRQADHDAAIVGDVISADAGICHTGTFGTPTCDLDGDTGVAYR